MIPIATTTISVLRRAGHQSHDTSGYDDDQADDTFSPIDEGVRAVIAPTGGSQPGQPTVVGEGEVVRFTLVCDPTDLDRQDQVTDEITGVTYEVDWSLFTAAPAGLDSTSAGLRLTRGSGHGE